jgi:hypothetical protein
MRGKSEAELELIRESGRWCAHAHRLLQTHTRPGVTEAQAGLRAGYEASLAMLDALGPDYDGQLSSTDGASAGYRGQIGVRRAWAYAVSHNIEFTAGDLLVTETSARSGDTTPSSSARWSSAPRRTRCARTSSTCGPPSRWPSTSCGPA